MPPVSRRIRIKSAGTRARTGKRYFRINYNSSKPKQYRTSTKARNGMKMLRIATNVPKSSDIRLRYNQTVLLKGNTDEQYRFRVQMNNPDGNGSPDLVDEISGAPTIFTNTATNLSQQMNDLFDQGTGVTLELITTVVNQNNML